MTDEQIAEIYSLGRESFFGGQRAFQFEAFPFRMTPINMAKHRNNPNMPFWKMIKEGYDHFEVTRQEPKVDFCEKNYVFDAVKAPNAKRDPVFEASAKCPPYAIPDELAEAVREKQDQDDAEMARLIARGTPVARLNTGIDGGMNKVFAAKLLNASTGLSEGGEGQGLSLLALSRAPGTIPSTVNPPHAPSDNLLMGAPEQPRIAASNQPAPTRVAAVAPTAQAAPPASEGFFSSLARKVGLGSADTESNNSATGAGRGKAEDGRGQTQRTTTASGRLDPEGHRIEGLRGQAGRRPPAAETIAYRPACSGSAGCRQAPAPVSGGQPIVQANSFESRFGAMK